jgi:hypothetical protein
MPDTYLGIYKGLIVDSRDPENRGRVVVQIPQVLGDTRSNWCEPIQAVVYAAVPAPGSIVWIMFVDGDIAQPVWFSPDMVNAAKIVAGAITAEKIASDYAYLGNIFADQIVGGKINADLIIAATMRTALSGARVEWGSFGIVNYDANGVPTIVQPTDSAQTAMWKGNGQFDGLTVIGSASFRSSAEIAKGAVLSLARSSTGPQSSPSIVIDWEYVALDSGGWFINGLELYNSKFWVVKDLNVGPRLDGYPTTGGGPTTTMVLGNSSELRSRAWGGVTRLGSSWYTLGWRDVNGVTTWRIIKYSDTGVTQLDVQHTPIGNGFEDGASAAVAIGNDGTNILVAQFDSANKRFRIQTYSASTLALLSTQNTSTNTGFSGPVVGVTKGTFDFGATRTVIITESGPHYWPFDSTGTYQPNDAWASPAIGSMRGVVWDSVDGRFYGRSVGSDSDPIKIYKHTKTKWTGTDPQSWWATSTWRDSDSGGTGTHETPMGPVGTLSMKKRARLTLTSPTIPDNGGADDPNSVGFYVGKISNARTNLFLQTLPADGVNTVVLTDTVVFTGTNPPSTNNFPSGVAAKIVNDDSTLEINGDGSIKASSITIGSTALVPVPPYWFGYLSTSPSAIAAATNATITGWVSDGSPNSSGITHSAGIFTLPIAGEYEIAAQVWWAYVASDTGGRLAQAMKTPASPVAIQSSTVAASVNSGAPSLNQLRKRVRLAANDQVFIQYSHTSTGNTRAITGTSADITWVQIRWVGP